jgi:hypothetical protein
VLREWLWAAAQQGRSKATLARRSASARGFIAWPARVGSEPPILPLASAKCIRTDTRHRVSHSRLSRRRSPLTIGEIQQDTMKLNTQ